MKTKRYIKPITTTVAAASSTILAGSGNTGEPSIPGGEGTSPGEAEAKPFTGFGGFNEGDTEESKTKKGWQDWSTN